MDITKKELELMKEILKLQFIKVIRNTRDSDLGVSIREVAEAFKMTYDKAEIKSLIKELQ